jgi:hypothetical protein
MKYSLFIDDERSPPRSDGRNWVVARDWEDVQMSLQLYGMPGYISFDHDLGETHTGYDIAKFLVELDMGRDSDFAIPEEFEFYVHSQNPIGKANIEGYLNNYLKFRGKENE